MGAKEFEEIFANVFEEDASSKRVILEALANGPLSVSDLAAVLGKERNGHLSSALEELVLSGFVEKDAGLNPHPKSVSIRTALVYEGELSKAVEGDGYFDALVPIEELLQIP